MIRKNKKILLVFVFVMLIGIGYAFLNAKLTINGTSNFSANSWLIYFDEIRANANNTAEATEPAVITDAAKTNISFDVNLEKPGDFYEFDVYIKNDGTIDAMIDEVIMPELTEEEKKYMTFSYTYVDGTKIKKCDRLNSHGIKDTRLRVEYLEDGDLDLVPEDKTRHFDVTIKYVQTSECTRDKVDVEVDPDGGIYNGSTNKYVFELANGNIYDLLTPTKENYLFAGWEEITETGSLNENKITANNSDVRVKARWQLDGNVVARINTNYYSTIQRAIDDASSGDTIYLLKNTSEAFSNDKNVTLNLDSHKVTGSGTNILGAKLTLLNGVIENPEGVGLVNNGTLTLGINDNNLCDFANDTCDYTNGFVSIKGTTKGIEQNGVFNFYDGVIEGKVANAGSVDNTPIFDDSDENNILYYSVLVDQTSVEDNQIAYLSYVDETNTRAVSKTIEGGVVYYYDLSDNFDVSAETGYKIYAVRNFEGAYELDVPVNSEIEFDINGKTVQLGNYVNNNGSLLLSNSDSNGELKFAHTIKQNGDLELKNIDISMISPDELFINNTKETTLKLTNSTVTNNSGMIIESNKKLTIKADDNSYFNGEFLFLKTNSDLVIDGGNYIGTGINSTGWNATYYNFIESTGGNIDIKKGNLECRDLLYFTGNDSASRKITIREDATTNGRISCSNYSEDKVNLEILGGTVKGKTSIITGCHTKMETGNVVSDAKGFLSQYGALISGGIFDMSGGRAYSPDGAGYTLFNTTLNMSGGEIINDSDYYSEMYAVKGIINMTGGIIKSKTAAIAGSDFKIYDGTIEGGKYGIFINQSSTGYVYGGTIKGGIYGIYQHYYSTSTSRYYGDLVVGSHSVGDVPNTTSPEIIGGTYGLYKTQGNGNTKIYDGVFKGKTAGMNGKIEEVPAGYEFYNDATEEIPDSEEVYHLTYLKPFKNIFRVGSTEYNTFDSMFEGEDSDELTVDVIDDAYFSFEQVIPSNKKVTLLMNNHTFTFARPITINGELTIIGAKEVEDGNVSYKGSLVPDKTTLFYNNGTLNLKYLSINLTDQLLVDFNGSNSANVKLDECIINGTNIVMKDDTSSGTSNIIINDSIINAGWYVFYRINNITSNNSNITSSSNSVFYSCGGVIINGGKIEGRDYTIYQADSATITDATIIANNGTAIYHSDAIINGGTIKGTTYGMYNNYDIITLNSGTIEGGKVGVYLSENDARLYFNGGTIKSDEIGIKVFRGIATIGENDNNQPNINNPKIIGDTDGINIEYGSLNFYDGVVLGKEDAINGFVNDTPERYEVKSDETETIDEVEYHKAYLVSSSPYLQVGNEQYYSFEDLFETETDDTLVIDLIGNGHNKKSFTIEEGKNVTIRFNGYTIDSNSKIVNNGTLRLVDNKVNVNGTDVYKGGIYNPKTDVIENNNQLIVDGGNYSSKKSFIYNSKDVIINDGTFDAGNGYIVHISTYSSTAISNVTINNGTFRGNDECIYIEDRYGSSGISNIYINNGTFIFEKAILDCFYPRIKPHVYIEDGYIECNSTAFYGIPLTINGGTIVEKSISSAIDECDSEINGGTIISKGSIIDGGTIIINGGTFTSDKKGFYYLDGLTIKGGTFSAGEDLIEVSGSDTTVTIEGGTFTSGGNAFAVSNGTLNIKDGTFEAKGYGIYQTGGTITLGEDNENENPKTTSPSIKGSTYGLYKTAGTINFYDGVFKGQVKAMEGTVDNIVDGSYITATTENYTEDGEEVEYKVNYLDKEFEFIKNTTLNKNYTNMATAISEARDNDKFEVFKNYSINNEITINKSVEIDLKGYNLNFEKGMTISNSKNVKFTNTNTNSDSTINTMNWLSSITNNGELIINNVDLVNKLSYMINNNGTLTITNSTIDACGAIKDSSTAVSNINNVDITSSQLLFNISGTLDVDTGNWNYTKSTNNNNNNFALSSSANADITIDNVIANAGFNISENANAEITSSSVKANLYNKGTVIYADVTHTENDEYTSISIMNYEEATLEINDSTLTIKDGITNNGKLTINGTDFISNNLETNIKPFIRNASSDELEITDSTMTITTSRPIKALEITSGEATLTNVDINITHIDDYRRYEDYSTYGIYMYDGTTNLHNTKINITRNDTYYNSYGIYVDDGIVNMASDGNEIKVRSRGAYGVYLNSVTATLTMGEVETDASKIGSADATVNKTSPYIEAIGINSYYFGPEGYGIYNKSGFLNYYDGKTLGSTHAKYGAISNWEYHWELHEYTDDNNNKYSVLDFIG